MTGGVGGGGGGGVREKWGQEEGSPFVKIRKEKKQKDKNRNDQQGRFNYLTVVTEMNR